jgi:hypothetical protein
LVSTNHTGLENRVTYYYSAFTYDIHGNYSRTAHAFATPDEGLDASIDPPSAGGCGMIRPGGNPPGPWQAADMVALLGVLLIRLMWRGHRGLRVLGGLSSVIRLGVKKLSIAT